MMTKIEREAYKRQRKELVGQLRPILDQQWKELQAAKAKLVPRCAEYMALLATEARLIQEANQLAAPGQLTGLARKYGITTHYEPRFKH